MRFKTWFEMSSYRNATNNVPQSNRWHQEGSVFKHTRKVRHSLDDAVQLFHSYKPLVDAYGPITGEDYYLLRIAAWLHDIGKPEVTAYTNPDGSQTPLADFQGRYSVQQMMSPEFAEKYKGRWQALGHEERRHVEAGIQKLGDKWHRIVDRLSPQDQEALWFAIEKHMEVAGSGMSRSLVNEFLDGQGNIINDRRHKMLLMIRMMDFMGREGEKKGGPEVILQSLVGAIEARKAYLDKEQAKRDMTPEQFEKSLWDKVARGALNASQIPQIMQDKYSKQ